MEINLTIVVQAINFYCFYLILRAFVFKPFVTRVLEEEGDKKHMAHLTTQQRQKVADQESANKSVWQVFQQECVEKQPSVPQSLTVAKQEVSPEALQVTQSQRAQLLASLKQTLIKRVTHVR